MLEMGKGGVFARYIPRLKRTDEDLQQHQHREGSDSSVGGLNVIKTYALAKLIHKYTHTHTHTHKYTNAHVVLSESYSAL